MESILSEIHPILITSPARRSGTTLLVRLLNSSNEALIFGENAAGELIHFTNYYLQKKLFLSSSQQMRDDQLRDALSGNNNDWTPDLLPELDSYFEALEDSCFGLFKYYQNYALEKGRSYWGIKEPGWNGNHIHMVKQTIPNLKVIYIQRPLADCLRSAKAVNIVNTPEDSKYFCEIYNQNLESLKSMSNPDYIHFVDYNNLVKNPEQTIKEIESFTNIRNINISVMDNRINTYSGDPRSSEEGYITPSTLTQEEKEMIKV